jgi:hypothetical protein
MDNAAKTFHAVEGESKALLVRYKGNCVIVIGRRILHMYFVRGLFNNAAFMSECLTSNGRAIIES